MVIFKTILEFAIFKFPGIKSTLNNGISLSIHINIYFAVTQPKSRANRINTPIYSGSAYKRFNSTIRSIADPNKERRPPSRHNLHFKWNPVPSVSVLVRNYLEIIIAGFSEGIKSRTRYVEVGRL